MGVEELRLLEVKVDLQEMAHKCHRTLPLQDSRSNRIHPATLIASVSCAQCPSAFPYHSSPDQKVENMELALEQY